MKFACFNFDGYIPIFSEYNSHTCHKQVNKFYTKTLICKARVFSFFYFSLYFFNINTRFWWKSTKIVSRQAIFYSQWRFPGSSYSKYNVKFAFVIPITQKQVDPNIQARWNIVAPSFMQVRKNESCFIPRRGKIVPFLRFQDIKQFTDVRKLLTSAPFCVSFRLYFEIPQIVISNMYIEKNFIMRKIHSNATQEIYWHLIIHVMKIRN